MSSSPAFDLISVAADLLNTLHKKLANGMLSCILNGQIVLELINDPLIIPRTLRITGDFNECEYTQEPDHRLPLSPWHAYIPVDDSYPPMDVKSWVFQDSIPQFQWFTLSHGCRGHITSTFLKKVETVIGDILHWLPIVYTMSGPPGTSLFLQLSDLQHLESFDSYYHEAATELWRVHRSVLIAWGYIIYSLTIKQDWQQHAAVTKEFIQDIMSSQLLDQPRRGLIIDAQDPPLFSEVITYL